MYRSYDYGRSEISKATGLSGVEAEHIARKFKENNIDPKSIDWMGAISDARDYGNRYDAVQRYLLNYYGVNILSVNKNYFEQMDEEKLVDVSSTKEGVKKLLSRYYNSDSKVERERIKDTLLNDNQMHNVLMTALYDGMDMPLAKRFLNEAMGNESVLSIPPVNKPNINNVTTNQQIPVISRKKWVEKLESLRPKNPDVMLSKLKTSAKKEAKSLFTLFSTNIRQTFKPNQVDRKAALKKQIEQLQMINEPIRLQLEYQRLRMQHEQLMQLRRMQPPRQNTMNLFAQMFGLQSQSRPQSMVERPGYYIEVRPKLPPGMKWRKIPKGRMK